MIQLDVNVMDFRWVACALQVKMACESRVSAVEAIYVLIYLSGISCGM